MCTSFAEKDASVKWGSEDKITSPAIASKFEAVSGTEMHRIVAWREWCTLERCLADDTLAWLEKVQIVSHACQCMQGKTFDVCKFVFIPTHRCTHLVRWLCSTKTLSRLQLKLNYSRRMRWGYKVIAKLRC